MHGLIRLNYQDKLESEMNSLDKMFKFCSGIGNIFSVAENILYMYIYINILYICTSEHLLYMLYMFIYMYCKSQQFNLMIYIIEKFLWSLKVFEN